MENFIPGQRWISNTESELGLGLVLDVSFNRVTVLYLASGERRIYARDNAPLTRVVFSVGDTVESMDEEPITITRVIENEGLLVYVGHNADGGQVQLEEVELNHHIQFNKPQDRLLLGQIDPPAWFTLRYQTWLNVQRHQQSPVKGLLGARTSLIPHQLFIAHECANRAAPRIMLADEVGLGKTIEAGLILHHRLTNGLAKRVLIVVPESLLHQWLVEMLRRFNLRFSVFDEARCLSELGEDGFDENGLGDLNGPAEPRHETDTPFINEQLVLCSQQFFAQHPIRQKQALKAAWDMVVVDEAHHLAWSEQAPSPEYLFIERLAQQTPSLILLTATPEQLGKASHFARLRLLDPDRFYSFAAFLEEERQFEPVAEVAKLLLADEPLDENAKALLAHLLKDDNVGTLIKQLDNPEKAADVRENLIKILLDHHGTGRILFRNSRQTVQGFPERERFGYALAALDADTDVTAAGLLKDPRYGWLVDKVKQLAGQKALLICKEAHTAISLEQTLKNRAGIASAVFHEGMTIIERDRAAAYFADPDSAARLLICSEIGSEGRNFQFVHQLVLWDLPHNPDLLQQRIGRLDRIGQKHVIQIHIPYLENSPEALLYRWYDEGMDAFRHNCSAAQQVADAVQDELVALLSVPDHAVISTEINVFIEKTACLAATLANQLHHGRDQLLELNSCRKALAAELISQVNAYENAATLWPYMEDLFECYGVETEFHSADSYIIRPGDQMRVAHFPDLPEDGMTVTVNRSNALAREELKFLTWEHPMVQSAMELVLTSETGNAVMSVIRHPALRAGQFLLEYLFVVECSAPAELQIGRFLPPTPIRIVIDQNLKDVTDAFAHGDLVETGTHFDKQQVVAFLNSKRAHLAKLLASAEDKAKTVMQTILENATQTLLASLGAEIKRLVRLKNVNPSIKTEEIEQLKDMTLLAHENIQAAQLRLDAVRFVIAS